MRGLAVEAQRFEFAMRGDQQCAARSFVRAARFDSDQPIFDEVHASHAIRRGDFVQLIEQRYRRELLAVYGNRSAALESDFDFVGLRRALSPAKTIHCHIASSGAFAGSSSTPPSWLRCQMLRSRL